MITNWFCEIVLWNQNWIKSRYEFKKNLLHFFVNPWYQLAKTITSYVKKAAIEVGSAAAGREDKKVEKYSNLSDNYHFVPMGVDCWDIWRHQGIKLVKQIGKKIQEANSEKLSCNLTSINLHSSNLT